MNFNYRFPAVKGIQAGREYYIGMVPLRMIKKLFPSDDEYILPEYRAQRRLNQSRIPTIRDYILDNRDTYVFSALAASIDGEFNYIPTDMNDIGILEVSMDATFLINDGQHRKAAIIEAIQEDASLLDETIPIVFFVDSGLARSQQMFTDLNKNAVRTSNSISELYDGRDEIAVLTRNVIWKIEFLNEYTDKERDILGKYSSKLFTLSTFYSANKSIIGQTIRPDTELFLTEFWSAVVKHMVQWQELENHEITKVDLRENYIATQNVVIQALAKIGNHYYSHNEKELDSKLSNIEAINWSRNNKEWYLRAINANGRVITNKKSSQLIANVIKNKLGIALSKSDIAAEELLKREREGRDNK